MNHSFVLIKAALLGLVLSLTACDNSPTEPTEKTFDFSFEKDLEGWAVEFSDYPVGEEAKYELNFAHAALPAPLDTSRKALKISGRNYSDDLFMFIKRKVTGLDANMAYSLNFTLKLASDAPNNHPGAGGSPAIPLKVGATQVEPEKLAQNDFYQMNIDKGNQDAEGNDMKIIGNTSNGTNEFKYVLIERSNNGKPFELRTDKNGEVWVIIGTDSGYESTTTLFYDGIHLRFKRK